VKRLPSSDAYLACTRTRSESAARSGRAETDRIPFPSRVLRQSGYFGFDCREERVDMMTLTKPSVEGMRVSQATSDDDEVSKREPNSVDL
jgi:hypothetical protein